MVFREVENVGEDVESMDALSAVGFLAGALQLVADGDFELGAMNIFQNEAGPSGDTNQVVLLLFLKKHLDLFNLQLQIFLAICLRHTTINII